MAVGLWAAPGTLCAAEGAEGPTGAGGWVGVPVEEARDALAEAAGEDAVADVAAGGAVDDATGGEGAEVEAAAVGDDDADATDADTSAGRGGGTPSWPGGKELITYRRKYEYQVDSRTDVVRERTSSSW